MPASELGPPPSPGDLLKAVEKLPDREFDQFVDEVLLLRGRRVAPHLTRKETELLGVIYQPLLSEDDRRRYDELKEKLRANTLTGDEHAELIRFTDSMEERAVVRVQALADLAAIRGVSVPALMDRLGLNTPTYE